MYSFLKLCVGTSSYDMGIRDESRFAENTPEVPATDDVSTVSFIVNTAIGKIDGFTEAACKLQTSQKLTSSAVSNGVAALIASYALYLGRPSFTIGQFTRTGKILQVAASVVLITKTAISGYEIARRRRAYVSLDDLVEKFAEEVVRNLSGDRSQTK